MKRVILAVVLAIASLAAMAQSNVTIYGVADAAYEYGSGDGTKFSGVQSGALSGSRIGFKGEEDLGNGLKGIFTLEYAVDTDTGTGLTSARQSFVGLGSQFGAVTLGRQYAPSGVAMAKNSAFEVSGATPMNQFLNGKGVGLSTLGGTMGTGDVSRWNNSIAYQSPTFAGFTGRAIYGFGESATTITGANTATAKTTDNGRFGLGGTYVTGPFNVDVIYQTTMNVRSTYPIVITQGGDVKEWYVGAGYDFTVVKVVGSYQTLNADATALKGVDSKVWSLGAIVPVSTNGKVRVEYAKTDFTNLLGVDSTGSSNGFGIGYTHDLSKRTTLYTNYTRITNDSSSQAFGANYVGTVGDSNYTVVAGLKHSF